MSEAEPKHGPEYAAIMDDAFAALIPHAVKIVGEPFASGDPITYIENFGDCGPKTRLASTEIYIKFPDGDELIINKKADTESNPNPWSLLYSSGKLESSRFKQVVIHPYGERLRMSETKKRTSGYSLNIEDANQESIVEKTQGLIDKALGLIPKKLGKLPPDALTTAA
jgi:hypothetical protein